MDNVFGFFGLSLIFAAVGGWIANLVKFVAMIGDGVTTLFIARAVGMFFAPLGSILGFF